MCDKTRETIRPLATQAEIQEAIERGAMIINIKVPFLQCTPIDIKVAGRMIYEAMNHEARRRG